MKVEMNLPPSQCARHAFSCWSWSQRLPSLTPASRKRALIEREGARERNEGKKTSDNFQFCAWRGGGKVGIFLPARSCSREGNRATRICWRHWNRRGQRRTNVSASQHCGIASIGQIGAGFDVGEVRGKLHRSDVLLAVGGEKMEGRGELHSSDNRSLSLDAASVQLRNTVFFRFDPQYKQPRHHASVACFSVASVAPSLANAAALPSSNSTSTPQSVARSTSESIAVPNGPVVADRVAWTSPLDALGMRRAHSHVATLSRAACSQRTAKRIVKIVASDRRAVRKLTIRAQPRICGACCPKIARC